MLACLESLVMIDHQDYRDELLRKRHPDTFEWLLEDERYQIWLKDEASTVLWINGAPGCGKSVLSSYLSERLARNPGVTGRGAPVVAYFFCRHDNDYLQTEVAILQHLLAQLLDQAPRHFRHYISEYNSRKGKTEWSLGRLSRVFRNVVTDCNAGPIFFLIDGLDECSGESQKAFLRELKYCFGNFTAVSKKFKLIITSRPEVLVRDHISCLVDISALNECPELRKDIGRYVTQEVSLLMSSKNPDKTLEGYTSGFLEARADGMFLWVSLVLDALRDDGDTSSDFFRETLVSMPKSLPDLYRRILSRITTKDRDKARIVLQWVVSAKRPLTLEELKIAIALRREATSMRSINGRIQGNIRSFLNSLFGSLLKIRNDNTVHLVHQSAREFLTDPRLMEEFHASTPIPVDNTSHLPFYICSEDTNLELAIACLRYLSLEEFDEDPMVDQIPRWSISITSNLFGLQKQYPLLNYAALYWPLHTLQSNAEDSHLWTSFRRLAQSPRKINLAHKIFIFSRLKSFHNDDFEDAEPLQILACHGLVGFAKKLLDSSIAINAQSRKTNALHIAIKFRHEPMVKLLLDRKADVSIQSGRYQNALLAAAAIGTKNVAKHVFDAIIKTKTGRKDMEWDFDKR